MSGSAHTLQRLERVLTMVPWLLEHEGVTVAEVAERFGVPPKEVVRDLDVLGYCGLPGYGGGDLVEASIVGDRISVRMADFFRRPLALSMREAVTLLLAARTLSAAGGLRESADLASAVGKLEAALGADARLAVDLSAPGDELLPALREAVERGRIVRLVYRSASKAETTVRLVQPWGVVGANGSWYLHGWCRDAGGARHFRVDRIREAEVTGEPAGGTRPETPTAPHYEPRPDDVAVTLDLEPEAAWVAEWLEADEVTDHAGARRVTFRTGDREWAARLVVRLGGSARVVAPAGLGERAAALAAGALSRYEPSGPARSVNSPK